jgi:hypothetical protein
MQYTLADIASTAATWSFQVESGSTYLLAPDVRMFGFVAETPLLGSTAMYLHLIGLCASLAPATVAVHTM